MYFTSLNATQTKINVSYTERTQSLLGFPPPKRFLSKCLITTFPFPSSPASSTKPSRKYFFVSAQYYASFYTLLKTLIDTTPPSTPPLLAHTTKSTRLTCLPLKSPLTLPRLTRQRRNAYGPAKRVPISQVILGTKPHL